MGRILCFLIIAAVVTGCATTPQRGERVPFQTVAAENAGKPFECAGYDAASDTCEALGETALRGDRFSGRAEMAFALDGEIIAISVLGKGRLKRGMTCVAPGDLSLRVRHADDLNFAKLFVEAMTAVIGDLGEICSVYYRLPDGGYLVESQDANGRILPELEDTIHYFSAAKTLRPIAE